MHLALVCTVLCPGELELPRSCFEVVYPGGLSGDGQRVFREAVALKQGEIGAMGLIRRTNIASFWKNRLAPWLLGDFEKNESVAHNGASAINQIKQAMHSCLRSTSKAMRQNWYRMSAVWFRNNRNL
jgi:hypothetical protein